MHGFENRVCWESALSLFQDQLVIRMENMTAKTWQQKHQFLRVRNGFREEGSRAVVMVQMTTRTTSLRVAINPSSERLRVGYKTTWKHCTAPAKLKCLVKNIAPKGCPGGRNTLNWLQTWFALPRYFAGFLRFFPPLRPCFSRGRRAKEGFNDWY